MSNPQPIVAPLSRAAIFLTVSVNPDLAGVETVKSFLGDYAGIVRAVQQRDLEADLTSVLAFGAHAWSRLFGDPLPAELHTFKEIRAGERVAPATAGDLLFHIRAQRMDLCFELATHVMERLKTAVSTDDETQGFRYFDDRDVIGFVDGTENPRGGAAVAAAIVGDEDARFAGGSYVIVQKYLHDTTKWDAIATEEQERIIGRRKLSDIELPDAAKAPYAHNVLTSITEGGKERKILRDNMPFGRPGYGEFGTYFIGYCRTPRITEQMLQNMFVGNPPGNYDRLLDVSRAVTGGLFFAPSADFIESFGD
jgi:porphyrinogen peroxidase